MGEDSSPRRVVRAPNHLGDVVLALPALLADDADLLVLRTLAPIVEMAGVRGMILPFDRGLRGWWEAVGALRRGSYREGILLTPSFSAAWMMRWGGVSHLRGTSTDGRSWMVRSRVNPVALEPLHRINQYRLLMGQDPSGPLETRRIHPPEVLRAAWEARLPSGRPRIGVFPGANAPARRWPMERFREVVRRLEHEGAGVVILGGPGEREVTRAVAEGTGRCTDLGGRTTVQDLSAVLSLCDLLLTNDTGPMHLAGALGTPTVTLWGPSDPAEVRQIGAPDTQVSGPALPCKPCYRNECRRSGPGTVLPRAHEECMSLIEVDAVMRAVASATGKGEV